MNEEDDLYESLPPSSTITTHMCAGALAGIGEHCVMYPFDCVKTRMQSLVPDPKANYRGVADALVTIFRHEGIGNTVRGIGAVVGGAGPAHALYFACYEHLKKKFSGGEQGNHLAHAFVIPVSTAPDVSRLLAYFLSKHPTLPPFVKTKRGAAGCVATVLHDVFMNPADVIKQRMQMYGSPYRTCKECGISILKTEGPIAFYRSFTTQLSMNVPFQVVHFMTYEVTQDFLNPTRQYDPLTHGISGAVAGAGAAVVTMPLDVCKTLLNTQEHCSRTNSISYVNGMRAAFQTVYEFQGIRGYFRGLTARVFFQMPATAISWSIYEFFKFFLHSKEDDNSRYLKVSSLQASSSK